LYAILEDTETLKPFWDQKLLFKIIGAARYCPVNETVSLFSSTLANIQLNIAL